MTSRRPMTVSPLWLQGSILTFVFGFSILAFSAIRIYQDSAPIPEQIVDAMIEHPILVNRPIVITPKGIKLCRPSEVVLDLLERAPEEFTKEDGEVVRRRRA